MAQDLWRHGVPQGSAYFQAATSKQLIVMLDVVSVPLPEPGCGEGCTCVGNPFVEVVMPRTWFTESAFPNGAWAYDIPDFCGPYVLLGDSEESFAESNWFPEEGSYPATGTWGAKATLPDVDGTLFDRVVRPIWDVITVKASDPLYQRVLHEEHRFYEWSMGAFYDEDDEDGPGLAAMTKGIENYLHPMDHLVRNLLTRQLIDWMAFLQEVGDECSYSQLLRLEQSVSV